ncbi:ABC transporter substrate-binding protein [Fulvivirga maritima]|uniref:ABC transporter substrate-binding protein n=1 Tax=Fulvivirga maritima TaxID=2904247 RepID=UPI001F3E8355|nr:ABC transporter substrate-binding protein [Fulvivirga maritima]UII27701.1 ABC transporter substrate-binding protein [Fulvivirga maritima]
MNKIYPYFFLVTCLLFACNQKQESAESAQQSSASKETVALEDAVNFSIRRQGKVTHIEVKEPYQGASTPAHYLLVPKGETVPEHSEETVVIRTPVSRIVCTATVHLPALEMLGVENTLKGFPSTQFISSEVLTKRVESGEIKELGIDTKINMETLTEIDPEVVFGYTMNGNSQDLEQISRLGIPVALQVAYLEETPLGRAEWIKFIAEFFDKSDLAEEKFQEIKKQYLAVKEKVKNITHKPTAFTGVIYNDVWYMSGGNSWAGRFFEAAGIDYLWKDDESTGSLSLAFEAVYEKAAEADLWIGAGQYKSLQELTQANPRYSEFESFKNNEVYAYIKRINKNGGNDYFETGAARPDLILSDLVKIAHPELLPEYETYFYQKLN